MEESSQEIKPCLSVIDKQEVIVSIIMITYGHEKYIKQAIEGVFKQECDFEIELIIANDCSPDNTDVVVNKYLKEHPKASIVKYFKHENNIGMMPNFMWALSQAKGKYIAICEGDDYWTDCLKLQKQVGFLEKNEEYGLTHTDSDFLLEQSGVIIRDYRKINNLEAKNGFVYDDLLKSNHISTLTVMFRKSLLDYYFLLKRNDICNFLMADYVMWLEFSQHCKFHYINETTATYRVLENSASNHASFEKKLLFLNSDYDIKLFFINKYPSEYITEKKIELRRSIECFMAALSYKEYKEALYIISRIRFKSWIYLIKIYYKKFLKFISF